MKTATRNKPALQKRTARSSFSVARVKLTTDAKGKRQASIAEVFDHKKTSLSHSPSVIKWNQRVYNLRWPLRCLLESDKYDYAIQNEMLGVIGTGKSVAEAEKSFNEEFDLMYRRYTKMPDSKMTQHLQQVKGIIDYLVSIIEE
jgi:hypothetical protein